MKFFSWCRREMRWLLLPLVMLALPAAFLGQGYFGTVSGVITDPSGAVIANAKVTLTDQEKGFTFEGKSDDAGRYVFRAVPPGVYRVLGEAPGFSQQEKTNIRVDVSTNPSANLRMKIGSTTSVVVTAQDQHLDTDDGTGATTVGRNLINNLPLIDRNVMQLAYLAPGTTNVDDQCDITCTGTNFTSNGSRNSTADVLMDGATVTNFEPNGGVTQITYVPSPEAVDEMRVVQSNFSAEYGFSGGSVVNMVTRSGTDQFHGEVYDFVRNTITDANNWFNDAAGIRCRRYTGRSLAARLAVPSGVKRFTSSSITTARANRLLKPTRPVFLPPRNGTTATLAKCAAQPAAHSMAPARAQWPQARFTIRMWLPMSRQTRERVRCAQTSSRITT